LYKKHFNRPDEFLTSCVYNDVVKDINIGNFKFPVKPAYQSVGIDRLKECVRIILDEHKEEGFFYLLSEWYKVKLERMG
jgi:hypothetical protein